MKQFLFSLASFLLLLSCGETNSVPFPNENVSVIVNPFIGTGGHGHTYPGASRPFGMMQLSPDTRLSGWDGCSGYHNSDSLIYGFSHTHLSGTGVSDYGDILVMPQSGGYQFDQGTPQNPQSGYISPFNKKSEQAEPGYYSVILDEGPIKVELSVAERSGMHMYHFPPNESRHVILDLFHRDKILKAGLNVSNKNEISGFRNSKGWAEDQRIYFVAQFSEKWESVEFDKKDKRLKETSHEGEALKAAFNFVAGDQPLKIRIGISSVGIDQARKNLEKEIPHWDFNKLREEAKQSWNKELNTISVTGGTPNQQTIFYSALYHSFLNPNLFSDVDNSYLGLDLKPHKSDNTRVYTVFSLWDTFRATHPLFTLVQQKRTLEFLKTFELQYKDGGILPIWELAGNYTGCMIGYHSIPVIADAFAKGIRLPNSDLLLEAMVHSANQSHLGLKEYNEYGYIPSEKEAESVSKTLEYAYDDWCIAMMAESMGRKDIASDFFDRSQHYKNLYDPETRFFRARQNGLWFSPFRPEEVNFNYTEANAWQYSMFVPHDIETHIELMGGELEFEKMLDSLFSVSSSTSGREQADITGLIGQYAHGNEPSHHMAYLYNYIGKPWKTQKKVRQILEELYSNAPDGLSGNEDCGQMSSWYVFSAMGFYPVSPGLPYYTIGSPLFDSVSINLENGKRFSSIAVNNSPSNIYIQSAHLNGKPYPYTFIQHEDISKGGEIVFEMGPTPNKEWGMKYAHRPKSKLTQNKIVSVPWFVAENRVFSDSMNVKIGSLEKNGKIYYSLGTPIPIDSFKVFPREGIWLKSSEKISAYVVSPSGDKSKISTGEFFRIRADRKIKLLSSYANQYNGGGDQALIDMQRGGKDFRTGGWQGYQYDDMDAVIDLGSLRTVEKVSASFLQDIRSWIWFPTELIVELSTDGINYKMHSSQKSPFALDQEGAILHDYQFKIGKKTRFIRIKARNLKNCPDWHLGAGGKSWIFADEILIKERD